MSIPKNCVFCTDTNRIIDFVPDAGNATAAITKFAPEYGTALIILPFEEAHQRFENSFKSEPFEITEERWDEMLGVLPPVAWKNDGANESFKISERTAGSITAIFVRINNRYFELSDTITLPHRECVDRVLRQLAISHNKEKGPARIASSADVTDGRGCGRGGVTITRSAVHSSGQ
jgi:hypothetical protein